MRCQDSGYNSGRRGQGMRRETVLGSYVNKHLMQSYKEIHSSRMERSPTPRKQLNKHFSRYLNGILVGETSQSKGLILFNDGGAVLGLKSNGGNRETLHCLDNMTYCYEVVNTSKDFGLAMFFRPRSFLTLSTFKKERQDGLQFSYDYSHQTLTKSLYKNNQLVKIIDTTNMRPHEAESTEDMRDMFARLASFGFAVEGCKRIAVSDTLTYFGEARGEVPHGYGVILSLTERYLGCFSEGLLEGFGVINFENGDVCEGLFRAGEIDRCCKYVRPVGVVYTIYGESVTEKEYLRVIEDYQGRFVIDSHRKLKSPASGVLLELKECLELIERRRNQVQEEDQSQESSQMSMSPSSKQMRRKLSKLRQSSNSPEQHADPSKKAPSSESTPLNVFYELDEMQLVHLASQKKHFEVGALITESVIKKQIVATSLFAPFNQYADLQPDPSKDFFESIVVQEVLKESVAEEFNKNIPKSFEAKNKQQPLPRNSRLFPKNLSQHKLIGSYIMEMIKEDTSEDPARENPGVKAVTDRIRKSRIFDKGTTKSTFIY